MSSQSIPKIYIAGIGMITPVGANAVMTAAAVRAGVSGYQECNFYDEDYNNVRLATVPGKALEGSLDEESLTVSMSARHARMLQMAKLAMYEIAPKLPKGEKTPLFLAGPEPLGNDDQPLNMAFIQNLAIQTSTNFDLSQCRINSMGRAGGLSNIKSAFRYLEDARAKFALVGGVDSFYDKETLNFLLSKDRLLCGERMDGFIPGEGAVFILLTNDPSVNTKVRLPSLYEPGGGSEKGHMYSNATYTGDGLSTAVTAAIQNARASNIGTIYSSMNGESFFAKEYGIAVLRNNEAFDEKMKVEHPADCYGDLGAASGVAMVALSAMQAMTRKDTRPYLICCSSDREYRSAVVMHA